MAIKIHVFVLPYTRRTMNVAALREAQKKVVFLNFQQWYWDWG